MSDIVPGTVPFMCGNNVIDLMSYVYLMLLEVVDSLGFCLPFHFSEQCYNSSLLLPWGLSVAFLE